MTTALVTGCAGFIGSQITEACLDRGDRVLGVDVLADDCMTEIDPRDVQLGDVGRTRPRTNIVRRSLGREPHVALREGPEHRFDRHRARR